MSRKFQEPSYWDNENDDPMQVRDEYKWMRTLINKRLDEQCEEYGSVQAQLLDSLPQYVVSHVDRIQHRLLWKRYMECKEELKLKHPEGDASLNELTLWHGTRETDPDDILNSETGFDANIGRPGFYGKGIYLAEYARYSNEGYAYSLPGAGAGVDEGGNRQLLLVKALCGSSKEYGVAIENGLTPHIHLKDTVRSDAAGLPMRFDSVHAGPHRPTLSGPGDDFESDNSSKMYVIYNNRQVYPAYIVTYKLRPPPPLEAASASSTSPQLQQPQQRQRKRGPPSVPANVATAKQQADAAISKLKMLNQQFAAKAQTSRLALNAFALRPGIASSPSNYFGASGNVSSQAAGSLRSVAQPSSFGGGRYSGQPASAPTSFVSAPRCLQPGSHYLNAGRNSSNASPSFSTSPAATGLGGAAGFGATSPAAGAAGFCGDMWGSDDDDDGEEQPQQARFFFNTASSSGGLWGSHCSSASGNGSNAGGIAPMKQLAGPPPVDIAPPDSFVAARRGAQQISPLVGFGRRAASASSSLQLQLQLKASCSDDDDELAAQGSSSGSFGAPATLGLPSPVSLSMPLGKHHVLQSGLLTASSSSIARNKASKFKTFVNLTPLSLPAANTQQHKPPGQSVPQRKQLGLARVNKAFTARPQQSHTHTNHSIQYRQQPQSTQQAQQVQNPQTLQQAQHVQKPQRLTIAASRSNTNIVTARTTTPTNSVKGRAVAVSAKQPAPAPPAAVSGKPAASSTSVVADAAAAAAAAAALALRQQAPPKPHRSTKRRLSAATGAAAAPAAAAKKVKSTPAVAISATATPPNANVVSASSAIQQLPPFSNASSDSNHIVIVMKDHPNTTMFQITNETTFGELFEAYGRSQATATSTYSFEYKGTLLKALELSPSAFGMEDGVCIDVIAGRATRAATSSKSALQTAAKAFARAPLPTHRRPTERGSSIAAQASRQQPELKEEEEEEDEDDDDDEASHASSQDFATSSEEENSPRRNRYKSIIASGASAANEGSSSNSRGPAAVAADVTVHVVASGTSTAAPTPTPTPATAALRLQLIAEDGSSTEMSATPNSTWRELRKTYAEMHAPPLDVAFLMLKFKGGKLRMRNKVAETENMQDGDTIDVHDTKE